MNGMVSIHVGVTGTVPKSHSPPYGKVIALIRNFLGSPGRSWTKEIAPSSSST